MVGLLPISQRQRTALFRATGTRLDMYGRPRGAMRVRAARVRVALGQLGCIREIELVAACEVVVHVDDVCNGPAAGEMPRIQFFTRGAAPEIIDLGAWS